MVKRAIKDTIKEDLLKQLLKSTLIELDILQKTFLQINFRN